MKKGKVLLVAGEIEREFDFEHAERILNHKTNTGPGRWMLPKKSNFELVGHELKRKPNKSDSPGAKA